MISFIVSTVGISPTFRRCLDSILRLMREGDQVIVVHQGRGFEQWSGSECSSRIQWLSISEMGLSKARNTGARAAINDILVFVDDDMVLDERYALNAIQHMQKGVSAVCGRILTPDEGVPYAKTQGEYPVLIGESVFELKRCLGGNMVFSKKDFWDAGGFDEVFGAGARYGGAEDIDIVLRLLYKKLAVLYAPDVIGYHPMEVRDNYEEYVDKMFRYGQGEGAVYAKHWFRYGRPWMLINYAGMLAKPLIRAVFSLFRFNPREANVYCRIIAGRLKGFSEYRKSIHES